MELSIIIPTKDRGQLLIETLHNAYQAILFLPVEIIVINDSKTDKIFIPVEWQNKVKALDNPKSGVASARNLGASLASASLLLFLDDDMLLQGENIQAILSLHRKYDQCSINLNWIYPPKLINQIKRTQFGRYLIHYGFTSLKGWNRGNYWSDKELFQTNGITSQCLSIEKESFLRSGGYNEHFPHAGFEDYDFARAMTKKGLKFYIYPLSTLYHNEADRTSVRPWAARKKRGGITRRVAVEMGYTELEVRHNRMKNFIYKILVKVKPLLILIIESLPNIKALDLLYFKLTNILLGTSIYEGYNERK